MKNKALVTSALLALGLISRAGAQNIVYVTGSTAFRTPVFTAISALPGWTAAPTIAARGGSHANGDNGAYMLFHGTYKGADTYIDCAWSGSEAGIASVAAPGANPVYFLAITASGINSAQPLLGETNNSPTSPDLCMADTSQAVSLTLSPSLVPMGTNVTLPGTVGVVPFTWLKNKNSNPSNFWAAVTNITIPQARRLFASPVFPALLTGNASHTNNYIYLVGRNSYSGTHVNTVLASYEPTIVPLQQFSIGGFPHSTIGSVGTIDPNDPNPLVNTVPSLNNGYDGGGDVANALSCDGSCQSSDPNTGLTGWMAVGYAGMSDAATARGNGAAWLTFNGVVESDGSVEEGQYSYWGYEHMYGRVGIGAGYQAVFGNDLAGGLPAQLGGGTPTANSSGININFMHAGKPGDAGDPFHFNQIF